MQEITLIFAGIQPFKQLKLPLAVIFDFSDPCVVASRDQIGTQGHSVVQERLALDLAITKHVWIARTTGGILTQKLGENTVFVIRGKIYRYDVYADYVCHAGCVQPILPT